MELTKCKILHDFDDLKQIDAPFNIAFGVFDGVHRGHQAVIAAARPQADGSSLVALTFDPHPRRVLAPNKHNALTLTDIPHRAQLLGNYGVDALLVIRFDMAMAATEAEVFLDNVYKNNSVISRIAVGEDWRFGHRRSGDFSLLSSYVAKHDTLATEVPAVKYNGEKISSTRIRNCIETGEIHEAQEMLGREFSVSGTVVLGQGIGRQLGFPTANLSTGSEVLPPRGVYAATASIDGAATTHLAAVNIGIRPTVGGDNQERLEVHILDFSADLYGKNVEVFFKEKIRNEMKFPNEQALAQQIKIDVRQISNQ